MILVDVLKFIRVRSTLCEVAWSMQSCHLLAEKQLVAERTGMFSKSIRIHLRCEVGGCTWSRHPFAEGAGCVAENMGMLSKSIRSIYAVKSAGACEVCGCM